MYTFFVRLVIFEKNYKLVLNFKGMWRLYWTNTDQNVTSLITFSVTFNTKFH
jgi:hypothetical protein